MTTQTDTQASLAAFEDYKAQCNGSATFTRHWTNCLIYTAGIELLADSFGAHWLVDLIASHQPKIVRSFLDLAYFQVWTVTHKPTKTYPDRWVAEAWSDTPGADGSFLLAKQVVKFSDLAKELSGTSFYVEGNGQHRTLLLPCER